MMEAEGNQEDGPIKKLSIKLIEGEAVFMSKIKFISSKMSGSLRNVRVEAREPLGN